MHQAIQLSPNQFRQHILLTAIAPFGVALFSLLAFFNAFFLQNYSIAFTPALLSLSFFIAWMHYKIKKDLAVATAVIAFSSSIVMLAFVYQNQNESFGLAWALLYPAFIIITVGHFWGLRFAVYLYLVLAAILFNGIGEWQQGSWDMTGFIRFSLSYLAMTYMSYALAYSNKLSYRVLEKAHHRSLNQHERVKQLNNQDSTTGVYSRGYLKQTTNQLPLTELQSQNTNLVFFIVQIVGFKNYVDHYGYEKGDKLLVKVSNIISNQAIALNGKVFRINGSEFSCLVITKNLSKTLCYINKIQESVKQQAFDNEMSLSKTVEVSIGVTISNDFRNFNFNQIFKKTDEALYMSLEKNQAEPFIVDIRNPDK